MKKLRVLWYSQGPTKCFYTFVSSVEEGVKTMDDIEASDSKQFKPDGPDGHSTRIRLEELAPPLLSDSGSGMWLKWRCEMTAETNPRKYLELSQ